MLLGALVMVESCCALVGSVVKSENWVETGVVEDCVSVEVPEFSNPLAIVVSCGVLVDAVVKSES